LHSLFRIDEPLPVLPGRSPFHIRGLYYDRLVAYLRRSRRKGALNDLIAPELRDFLSQRFHWTGWYDALPAVPLCAAIASVRQEDFEELTREQTRRGALAVIPSFFRLALRVPGPAAFHGQTASIVSSIVDFVDLELDRPEATRSSGWGRRVPLYLAPHTANLVVGFFGAVLEMRHRGTVRGRYTDVVKDGERAGFETVSIRYEFEWDG
jgi:hypothetical protein